MREIKFRAWDKLGKEMIFPDEIWFNPSSTDLCSKWSVIDRIKGIALSKTDSCNGELMQYTGLKDKTGKEIYDSDICDYYYAIFHSADPNASPSEHHGKGIIIFEEGAFWIKDIKTTQTVPLHYQELSFKIIGNIHENPKLIKTI